MKRLLQLILILCWVCFLFHCVRTPTANLSGGNNTGPQRPSSPRPVDTAEQVPINVTLQWSSAAGGWDALYFDVYLDTVNPPERKVAQALRENFYAVSGLQYNTQYYWFVRVYDKQSATADGPVWTFRTVPAPLQ